MLCGERILCCYILFFCVCVYLRWCICGSSSLFCCVGPFVSGGAFILSVDKGVGG